MDRCIRYIVWKNLYHEAKEEGIRQEMQNGIQKVNRVNRLTLLLMEEKRYEDLIRSASDAKYQDQLFESYGL